jgi:GDPmannose 4,6-dehydratase
LASLYKLVYDVQPQECYHLAAQSFVSYSFEDEASTFQTNIAGTHHLLMALKECAPGCRFYFAGSSEMFGKVAETPQNEKTPFRPRSAYAISKVAGYHLSVNYREAHGLYACCGILFNHESPRRGMEFVTRKITSHVAKIRLGLAQQVRFGNIEARRDWGHARDYVKAMWLMLQQDEPENYVIATGENHSVREFLELAFQRAGLRYEEHVVIDPNLYRPTDVETLQGDYSKAKHRLGWKPASTFRELIQEMVDSDLDRLRNGLH